MKSYLLAGALPAAALAVALAQPAVAQVTDTLNGGGSTNSQPVYTSTFTAYSNATPSIAFAYDGISSSTGQTAFLTNNINLFNSPSTMYGTFVGTTVHYAASDAPLSSSQVSGYSLSAQDGPVIQIPTVGVGVAIPFENTKLKTKLTLTDAQLCGIFSGDLTNWNQISSKATPGTIEVVYRSDSAAATFLLTQHFNAVCTSSNSTFTTYPVAITKTFATLFPSNTPPANFTGESGSAAVASEVLATALSIGYVSPDYTSIDPNSANTTSLPDASLTNPTTGTAYTPSVANIQLGLKDPGTGSTNTAPPSTKATAANPLNWFPTVPVTTKGYSIVGYSSFDLSSCYSDTTIGSTLIAYLTDLYSNKSYQTLETNSGSAPLANAAAPFVNAIEAIFTTNKKKYGLDIDDAKTCAAYTGR